MATYLRRAYTSFLVHVFDVPPRLLAFLCLLLFLVLPLAGLNMYILGILITINTFAIFALSWDLLVGRTGQISLGHALFFGIGAYTTALLFTYFNLPLWITIPLAVLAGFLVALLIGFPCLRVKGPYLALVTMAFPIILGYLVLYFSNITRGEIGLRGLPTFFHFSGILQQRFAEYYFTLGLLVASAIILYKIANSKTGIVFVSILDNELASKASGINVTRYKLMAFGISGLFASMAGAVNAHLVQVANPPTLSLTNSFLPVIVTILGGLGTIYGPLVGALMYYLLDSYVLTILIPIPTQWAQIKLIIFILIVIILILKWPRGFAKVVVDKLKDLEEARELEERGKKAHKSM